MIRGEWSIALEEQAQAFADYNGAKGQRYLEGFFQDVATKRPESVHAEEVVARSIPAILFSAEPIYVTAEMTQLVQAAGETLPSEDLREDDVPLRAGFAYFAAPLWVLDRHEKNTAVAAAAWFPAQSNSGEPGIVLVFFSDLERDRDEYFEEDEHELHRDMRLRLLPKLVMLHCGMYFYGVATRPEGLGNATPMGSMMLALWRLMEQRIAVVTEEQAQRAVRRRAARIHQEYDRLIRVVTLRRPKQPSNGEETSTVDWSHRWIVRGHWRSQWYPARGVHRHIWIAPFVKGPDDKPLELPVDRVFRLAR